MRGRRILYALALLGAFMGQLLDVGYLFHFIFLLTLTFPLLALAVSLPAMLGCEVRLTAETGSVRRGGKAAWSLSLHSAVPLPIGRVKGRLMEENSAAGTVNRRRFSLRGAVPARPDGPPSGTGRETWAADTSHCGLLTYRIERAWVCDCLGLFALPCRRGGDVSLLVLPIPEDPGRLDLPEGTGRPRPVPRGRSASGEDYELRPYREGDSLRAVHWKQSAKRDELVTRESLEDPRPLVVLTFDHFGGSETLDRVLDRLEGHARALLRRERPFEVRWVHPETGNERRYYVDSERTYSGCLAAALRDPSPAWGSSILRRPLAAGRDTVLHHIHITGEEARHDPEV